MILEPKLHYRTSKEDVPEGEHVVPLGRARIAREGSDVTLVAYGAMVPLCEKTAEGIADDVSCEVLDLRSLKPLDEDALLESVGKTGRAVLVQEAPRVCGFAAEVAAVLAEKAISTCAGRCSGSRATTCPTRTGRSRTPTCPRSSESPMQCGASSRRSGVADRLRLWLERGETGITFATLLPRTLFAGTILAFEWFRWQGSPSGPKRSTIHPSTRA